MTDAHLLYKVGKALEEVTDVLAACEIELAGVEVQRRGLEGDQWVVFARLVDDDILHLYETTEPHLAIAVAEAVAAVLELHAERI